jgi:hypothetical protein
VTARETAYYDACMQFLALAVVERWLGRAGFTTEPLRWFCGAAGQVVIEQRGHWGAGECIVADAFRVVNGRVARHQRFDELHAALASSSLSDDDEVLHPTPVASPVTFSAVAPSAV